MRISDLMIGGMMSRTAEYALRAVVALRQHGDQQPMLAREISAMTGIPGNYLSKILHSLGRAGFVSGERGRSGGFRLRKTRGQITAYDIVNHFDNLTGRRRCFMGNSVCSEKTACPAHHMWESVRAGYESFLHRMTLNRLASLAPERPKSSTGSKGTKSART